MRMTPPALTEIPYYWRSLDWDRLIEEYPPSPLYEQTVGRLSPEALRELQNRRFLARVSEAWDLAFYRDRWRSYGLEPGDIASLDDIRKIPPFTSDDLREGIVAEPPFGSHHPPLSKLLGRSPLKIQTSGGTTGKARATIFDPVAWEVLGIQSARSLYAIGARPGDVVQIPSTPHLGIGAWAGFLATFYWLGCVPLTTGSGVVTPSERQLEYALDFGTNGWWIGAEYAGRLVEIAASTGFDLHQLPTRWMQTALGPDIDGVFRRQLQNAWGAPVFDRYGTHEIGQVGYECRVQRGMHINEDTVYLEILGTDDNQPLQWGEKGNLVATSLHRSVPPFIRYNLRDLIRIYPHEECECGLSTRKLSTFLGRSDEMIKLRSQNLYPRACQPIVAADDRTNGQFLCVAYNVGTGVSRKTEVTVRVERKSADVDAEALARDLHEAFHRDLGVRVGLEIVEPGALAPDTGINEVGERKIRRLLDLRRAPGQ
jgi:phenylacetate-CoA ligase